MPNAYRVSVSSVIERSYNRMKNHLIQSQKNPNGADQEYVRLIITRKSQVKHGFSTTRWTSFPLDSFYELHHKNHSPPTVFQYGMMSGVVCAKEFLRVVIRVLLLDLRLGNKCCKGRHECLSSIAFRTRQWLLVVRFVDVHASCI